jgi:ubiquinone/menaquinone biosynthesis C-methylase UbiE
MAKEPTKKTHSQRKTDWDNVAHWYDNYLVGEDTYQAKVIAPNLLRMLAVKKGSNVLDIACGQGYFARQVAAIHATVIGIDQSAALIEKAKNQAGVNESYLVGNAEKLGSYQLGSFDTIFSVLALENMRNVAAVLEGMNNLLKKNGKVVLVLLHPAFRIPQHADWGYDTKKELQFRKVEKYLSEVTIPIELAPFNGGKKVTTTTFHRSLQWYMKAFRNAGFSISGLEEWISHKKSAEIPMFLALELRKM